MWFGTLLSDHSGLRQTQPFPQGHKTQGGQGKPEGLRGCIRGVALRLDHAVFGRAVRGGSYQVAPMNSTLWLVTSSSPSFSTLTGKFSGTLDTPCGQ